MGRLLKWVAKHACEELKEELNGKSVAGADPSCVAKEFQRSVGRQAPKWDEETRRRRRMGEEKTVRHGLVARGKVSMLQQGGRHRKTQADMRNQLPEGLGK